MEVSEIKAQDSREELPGTKCARKGVVFSANAPRFGILKKEGPFWESKPWKPGSKIYKGWNPISEEFPALALKRFLLSGTLWLVRDYLDGSLCEWFKWGRFYPDQRFKRRPTHTLQHLKIKEIEDIQNIYHIVFNSIHQLKKFRDLMKRVNPPNSGRLKMDPEYRRFCWRL